MSQWTRSGKANLGAIAVLLLVVVGLATVQLIRSQSVAPLPEGFAADQSLDDAIDAARVDDRVVVAIATADWCGPCQAYKRGALSDASVQDWIDENAVAVLVDVDVMPADAHRLMEPTGVRGIPATFLLHDGQLVAHFTGGRDAESLQDWLERHTLALR